MQVQGAQSAAALVVDLPARVFVATTDAQMLAVKVLDYSIRKHASIPVTITPIHLAGIREPMPRDPANWPRTPFSFQRFLVPQLCGWQGRAIYLDSDMQVFRDIAELWTLPMNGAEILIAHEPENSSRRPQYSVMLLDCGKLSWDIRSIVADLDAGHYGYEDLMHRMVVARDVRQEIVPDWNSLERYEAGRTALLHYTDMETQPWVSRVNPYGYLWCRDLFEAIDAGFIGRDYVEQHVTSGYVRPSLLYQIKQRVEDPRAIPEPGAELDRDFEPPLEDLPFRIYTRPGLVQSVLRRADRVPGVLPLRRLLMDLIARGRAPQ